MVMQLWLEVKSIYLRFFFSAPSPQHPSYLCLVFFLTRPIHCTSLSGPLEFYMIDCIQCVFLVCVYPGVEVLAVLRAG